MEPEKETQENGLAPIVGWSNITPSLRSSPSKTPGSIDGTPVKRRLNAEYRVVPLEPEKVTFENLSEKDSIVSSSSDRSIKTGPKVPDGGWGWMVVFASLVISMVADGISFSFGLLYIEFLHEYGESKSTTAWIGSLFMAVPLLSGPIMSALVDKFGCRKMTMLGGFISGVGFILSSQSNSIILQYINFGVIAGIGLGLNYVTAVVSIAYWFDKKRAIATGLGACGTGIGTFVYAPMTQYFIEEYGWRGTVLLLAGTFFQMCVCGAVMRAPEWWIIEQNKLQGKGLKNASSTASISGSRSVGGESTFPGIEEIRKLMKSGESPEYILTTLATTMAAEEETGEKDVENKDSGERFRSVVNLPTFVKESEKLPIEVLETLSSNKKIYNVILENYPSILLCRSTSEKGLNSPSEVPALRFPVPVTMSVRLKQTKRQKSVDQKHGPSDVNVPLLKTDSKEVKITVNPMKKTPLPSPVNPSWIVKQFQSGGQTNYLQHIKIHRNSVVYRGALLNTKKYRLRASSCPDIYRNSMITLAKEEEEFWYTEWVDFFKGMADFSLFLELHFLLLCLSTILLFTWFIVPYFYIAEHLTRHGYTEDQCSKLISLVGITNTIGMLSLGWAGDQPWMHVQKTFSVCLFLCGFSTFGMPLFTNQPYLLIATSAFFGLFFASSFAFTPVVLVQLIPMDRFATGYGLILLCQGIGNLLGPPLSGFIFDITGTWDLSFYLAGIWIFISGIFLWMIPMTKNRKIYGSGPLAKDADRVSMA